MNEYEEQIESLADDLLNEVKSLELKEDILKSPKLKQLYQIIPKAPTDLRPALGQKVNKLKSELQAEINSHKQKQTETSEIDVTAPFDLNIDNNSHPELLKLVTGSSHPLLDELEFALSIFRSMGFNTIEARQLDDEYHMFGSLNFPEDHPARDNWDTFVTDEGFLPIAHTSTMQNRILQQEPPIATVSYGRCFRNEDVDATHEHTFYQMEGVLVDKHISLSDLMGTFKKFFEKFFGESLQIRTQPAHFPFVEPGLEFFISKPKSLGGKPGEWLEVMGCGMIHPNVLKESGLDPKIYSGFAWGAGLDRLVMLKRGIEDIRHLESAKLEFLKRFNNYEN